jgi:hypothetical protein
LSFLKTEVASCQNKYTGIPLGGRDALKLRKTRNQFSRWMSAILNFIRVLSGIIYFYVTTISFQTIPVYYKLQNALCDDEYSVHTMNSDVYIVCGVPVTVYLNRAECSLSDADWHFVANISSCNLLNVCITNREQIARNFRISNENKAADLSRVGLNLVWNSIGERAWKFGIRKSEECLENDDQASVGL